MVNIYTKKDVLGMIEAGKVLAEVHRRLRTFIKEGVTTLEIDAYVESILKEFGATAEQKGYEGFPYATCASVNDEICHGFPTEYALKDGDIVTIDMVVNLNGSLADSAWTYAVGDISEEARHLMDTTLKCLYLGIKEAKVGNRLGDIGHAIQSYAEGEGFSVVREFVGHGIGKTMHEDPQVLHYGEAGRGLRIQEGMVFTIEPMINEGTFNLKIDKNGWTARTRDGKLSAQYEHQLAITKDGPIIITDQGDTNPFEGE
ncbi:MAG: type I methionyl aminopeptidase [Peptoniphilus duerdenii]|uniref:Methionine aminopeptidase n=1 Tax=Peptoniphilus duerdenii ATCC BAA-1640 TaxID=862517 RepID=E0NL48_9FIRM|nr:type I methionyl aminopeptidase [Peptoniphilus duerdenii]EFM25481.1 methionine aminopeptidase, type I [Peptoniphilus duerdenii ATCC BAA-1640]MDK8276529.1 type I methionyl aminopeptidase [Peptoniphilus duerdenii]